MQDDKGWLPTTATEDSIRIGRIIVTDPSLIKILPSGFADPAWRAQFTDGTSQLLSQPAKKELDKWIAKRKNA